MVYYYLNTENKETKPTEPKQTDQENKEQSTQPQTSAPNIELQLLKQEFNRIADNIHAEPVIEPNWAQLTDKQIDNLTKQDLFQSTLKKGHKTYWLQGEQKEILLTEEFITKYKEQLKEKAQLQREKKQKKEVKTPQQLQRERIEKEFLEKEQTIKDKLKQEQAKNKQIRAKRNEQTTKSLLTSLQEFQNSYDGDLTTLKLPLDNKLLKDINDEKEYQDWVNIGALKTSHRYLLTLKGLSSGKLYSFKQLLYMAKKLNK